MNFRCFLLFAVLVASAHTHKLVKRMINGEPANISDYPYLVFIGSVNFPCQNCVGHRCGGAILSKHYVLTAAHCVRYPKEGLFIRAGSSYQKEGGSAHHLDDVTLHKNFSVDATEYRTSFDIAVVRVKEPFVYSANLQRIDLPVMDHRHIPVNSPAKTAGWGKVVASLKGKDWFKDGYLDRLHKLDFHVVDTKAGSDSYVSWGSLFEGQFCAATDDQVNKSVWYGDSGSPLVVGRELVGITIWGGENYLPSAPGVYTDVGYLRDWIDEHVEYDDDKDRHLGDKRDCLNLLIFKWCK